MDGGLDKTAGVYHRGGVLHICRCIALRYAAVASVAAAATRTACRLLPTFISLVLQLVSTITQNQPFCLQNISGS